MSQNWYTCAECSETFHEDSISYCEKCDEHICDNCTTDKKPWRFIGEFEDILDNCPICAKDAKDAANPHKDFLGKALNIGDAVIAIWGRTSRTYLYKAKIKTLSPIRATVTSSSWKNTSIEKDLLIKI